MCLSRRVPTVRVITTWSLEFGNTGSDSRAQWIAATDLRGRGCDLLSCEVQPAHWLLFMSSSDRRKSRAGSEIKLTKWPTLRACVAVHIKVDQVMSTLSARKSVEELLNSEISYTEALQSMMDKYYRPLRQNQFKLHPILCECDIDQIFLNVRFRFASTWCSIWLSWAAQNTN